MARLIDGKHLAETINHETRKEILAQNLKPQLAAVLVGNDPASKLYVSLKEKACKLVGIEFHSYVLPEEISQEKLLETIDFLNNDPEIDGIIVQLPLPDHLDTNAVIAAIDPQKDADGFGPHNLDLFMKFSASIIPALPAAIYELIKSTGIDFMGKHAAIIANSEIFARPIINMMKYKGATAEYLSPENNHFPEITAKADIVIIAMGRKWFLKKTMVKKNSIIIDVGINKEGEAVWGDVDPEVDEYVAFRSPVPGGVGPMTIAMLLRNVVELHKKHRP